GPPRPTPPLPRPPLTPPATPPPPPQPRPNARRHPTPARHCPSSAASLPEHRRRCAAVERAQQVRQRRGEQVEDRAGIDAEEDRQRQQRPQRGQLAPVDVAPALDALRLAA